MLIAACPRPHLLVLDEPTSGLDPLMEQTFRQCAYEARQRGQTVFLSSHILSEVEALCDRVGILVDGPWSKSGPGGHAPPLRSQRPGDLRRAVRTSSVSGASVVEVTGSVVRCQVLGPIEPLLKVLAEAGVRSS